MSRPVTRSSKREPTAIMRSQSCIAMFDFVHAVHADHAEEMRVARRQCAEPHQGQGAGRIDQPHEFGEAGAGLGAGIDQPAAAIDQRPLRRRDQRHRLGDARRVGLGLRPIALVLVMLRPGGVYVAKANSTSFGRSTTTGPGRPLFAT